MGVKPLGPLLAALTLLLPRLAEAVKCDFSGYNKTIAACSTDGDKETCVDRLVPVLVQCQHKLNDDAGNEEYSTADKQRIAALKEFAANNPDIKDASLKAYGKSDPALAQLGFAPDPTGAPTSGDEPPAAGAPPKAGNTVRGGNGASRNRADEEPATAANAAKDLKAGNPAAAEKKLDQMLAENPNDAEALALRAQAREALGNREGSADDARKALQLDPSSVSARLTAEQHAQLERAAGVGKKFGKLAGDMLHGPDDAGAGGESGKNQAGGSDGGGTPRGLAGADARPGSNIRGGAATDSSGFSSPPGVSPLMLAAMRKQALGDYTGALIDISQALDANPNDAAALTLRAELDIQLGNYLAGISDADRALGLTPDSARALRARSYAEYETKLYRQALADATRAVALDPKNGLGYLYKALAEDKLGLSDAALADLNQALALDPTLKRLAAPLLKKYNLGGEAAGPAAFRVQPWMVRGGFVGLAMLLVLVGLLGTQKAKTLRVLLTPRRAQTDAPAAVAVDLAPGTVLGGTYRILREIGRGGMGVVYEGLDQALQRRVAVKRLIQDEQTMPEDVERFLREARLVAQLKHPNLAQIYAVAVEREPFLVFEFVDGETLDGVLSRSVVLPIPAARRIVGEIAAALTYAHGHNIIHRDLKPSNVMIAKSGAAKVMDFGIAHRSRASATQMTQTIACGTPPYMAPEQGMGSVSKASDLYALGVMTYELLTGRRPFDGPNYLAQKLERRYEPATKANPALPPALDHFFETALDPDPTKRPATAAAFMEAFGRACDATPRRQASTA